MEPQCVCWARKSGSSSGSALTRQHTESKEYRCSEPRFAGCAGWPEAPSGLKSARKLSKVWKLPGKSVRKPGDRRRRELGELTQEGRRPGLHSREGRASRRDAETRCPGSLLRTPAKPASFHCSPVPSLSFYIVSNSSNEIMDQPLQQAEA